jgi:hypothetical protein
MNPRKVGVCVGLVLSLAPALARAEVSVQLDAQGRFKRLVVLARGNGPRMEIWKQMRGRVPAGWILNPLGDTYGDLAPVVAIQPTTGLPWAVWPANEGNRKRLVLSRWDGTKWTEPQLIARLDPLGSDQLEPRLAFDAQGAPYLLYTEAGNTARVMFLTVSEDVWAPPLQISDDGVDSRQPTLALKGSDIAIGFQTPMGPVSKSFSALSLIEAISNLMDSPIPPGSAPAPPANPGGGGTDDPPAPYVFHH